MKRCDRILHNKIFISCMEKTAVYEKDRIYCLHDIAHAFDTARIAYIKSLEEGSSVSKELIYAAALIHDIGRAEQYENGTPHEEASAKIGRAVLEECGFSGDETDIIITAVLEHRVKNNRSELGALLAYADDKSRMCMLCRARGTCKWNAEDMNTELDL